MRAHTISFFLITMLFNVSGSPAAENETGAAVKKPTCINGVCILPTGDTLPAGWDGAGSQVKRAIVKDTSGRAIALTDYEARDEFPVMAADSRNVLWTFWVSDREGDPNIYSSHLREAGADGEAVPQWSPPLPVTKDKSDDYSPVVTTDSRGVIWLAWCSKREGNYDIFVKRFDGRRWSEPVKVSMSREDDMHPDITSDANDNIWVVWYTWAKMGGVSRDRNIYAAYFNGKAWSTPKLMSPVEDHWDDHADPAIAAALSGRVWMCWVTDYHPQSYANPAPARGPTIFARSWAGGSFSEIAPPVPRRGFVIDYSPEMATDGEGRTWIVWEASQAGPGQGRNIVSAFHSEASRTAAAKGGTWSKEMPITSDSFVNADPSIVIGPKGRPWVLWHSNRNGNFDVFASFFDAKWSNPIQITDSNDDETYPNAIVDKDGRFWVAWQAREKGNAGGRQRILVKVCTECMAPVE